MRKDIILLFDSIRDPRDIAEVIHLGLAANINIEFTGSSLLPTHQKVLAIIDSWIPGFRANPKLKHFSFHEDFEKRILELRKKGFSIIGTSPHTGYSLFESNLSKGKHVIVFGTETSGLSGEKIRLMDEMLCVPMENGTKFFTIRSIAPMFAYEAIRQKKL